MSTGSSSTHPFRKLLDNAEGKSEFVIAVILDIRNFSSFAMKVESVQTSAFLKRIYKELIDRYFASASFIKPTGDGLLLAFPYNENNLAEIASQVIKSCLSSVAQFTTLCERDPMINFKTPEKIGIGICRGAATRLMAEETIIDYSGRPFNIASRLMELARPSGIVLDSSFGSNLIPAETSESFSSVDVYLRGIDTGSLTKIYYTKKITTIPEELQQIPASAWKEMRSTKPIAVWSKVKNFVMPMEKMPIDKSKIFVDYEYQTKRNVLAKTESIGHATFQYTNEGGVPIVRINPSVLAENAKKLGASTKSDLTIILRYLPSSFS